MSVVLYFSKVNLNSSHIYRVYEDKSKLSEILEQLYVNINEKVEYEREDLRTIENGYAYNYSATYSFNFVERLEEEFPRSIVGSIIKRAPLFFNEIDEQTGRLNKRMVDNAEVIEFYFDIYKEIVVFYTTNRFGYQEFNQAFGELLSKCMPSSQEVYYFEVSLLKEGLSVTQLKEQLKNIGNLQYLKIDIIPPNADDELLDKIQRNGEKYLNDIKDGNVTHTSILFSSKSIDGLNLDSKVINEEIEKIEEIHSELTAEKAIQNGYVRVEAKARGGRMYTTNDNRPVKDTLEQKPTNPILFARACKSKVASLFKSFL